MAELSAYRDQHFRVICLSIPFLCFFVVITKIILKLIHFIPCSRLLQGSRDELERKLERSSTLYVGNLSFYTTEEQIQELFSRAGDLKRIIMGLDKVKKTPCGFCFIEYPFIWCLDNEALVAKLLICDSHIVLNSLLVTAFLSSQIFPKIGHKNVGIETAHKSERQLIILYTTQKLWYGVWRDQHV